MRRALAIRAALVVMIALAIGCGGRSSSPAEPAARSDSIVLLSVDPPEGTHMPLGGRVQVTARVRYTFQQPAGGTVEVVVTPLPFGLPLLTDPLLAHVHVDGQEGEATLRFAILLDDPDHQLHPGPIAADLFLLPQGQNQSSTSVQIRYEVVP